MLNGGFDGVIFRGGKGPQFADEVNGPRGDNEAVNGCERPGLLQGGLQVRSGVGGNVLGVGDSEQLLHRGRAGVGNGGKEKVIAATGGVAGGGVEEREEDARHLVDLLVGEAGEEKGAGTVFGEPGEHGAESPGAGGVMGDVEQKGGRGDAGCPRRGRSTRGGRASGCRGCQPRGRCWAG